MDINILPARILKISEFLNIEDLTIPEYQRPYKWTVKNVNQLIDDILKFKKKDAYRIGTIVVHYNNKKLEIVDGQQRTITLILLLLAIKNSYRTEQSLVIEYEKYYNKVFKFQNLTTEFSNQISINNIKKNYQELNRRVKELDKETLNFLLNKCEVVYIELTEITEAFQFFDSQNARGRDLEPHDLLKAYHLREMHEISEIEKTKLVDDWEEFAENGKLSELFDNYLFKIRNWSRGKSARYFTKNDVDVFKGISINCKTKQLYPYSLLYQMVNIFVEDYNNDSSRKVDFNNLSYPFQLDLPLLNGKRFFEMITHYKKRIEEISSFKENRFIEIINNYKGNYRVGDKYVRMLFECALIYYIDKFGLIEVDRVITKLFIWAYKIRLELKAVQLASIDNKALHENIFKVIKDANTHNEVINIQIDILKDIDFEVKEIKDEFIKLGYYNEK